MNLELTTACPLRCPQCYCNLNDGEHLDLEIAKKRINEGVELGVTLLDLSGGETMCYPYLYDLVSYASQRVKEVNVALSGAFFDQQAYERLVSAGITGIYISLNGSTKKIDSISRDGYDYAINALKLLQKNNYKNIIINWVMHSSNADDFLNVVHLAEQYDVKGITILSFKPDSHNTLDSFPTMEQIAKVSKECKHYSGKVKIGIETCYSNFLAYHLDTKLLGNLNITDYKGCGAGRDGISINVHGQFTPCRHIDCTEPFDSMRDYWEHSKLLKKLRSIEEDRREPCKSCGYNQYCRHCQAINWQMNGDLYLGFASCPVYKITE